MPSPNNAEVKKAQNCLEQNFNFFLKRICGVQSTTPNPVVLAETTMSSLKNFWWRQSIQSWNSLTFAPESSLHKIVPFDNFSDAITRHTPNFSSPVFQCLKSFGISVSHRPSSTRTITITITTMTSHRWSKLWKHRMHQSGAMYLATPALHLVWEQSFVRIITGFNCPTSWTHIFCYPLQVHAWNAFYVSELAHTYPLMLETWSAKSSSSWKALCTLLRSYNSRWKAPSVRMPLFTAN